MRCLMIGLLSLVSPPGLVWAASVTTTPQSSSLPWIVVAVLGWTLAALLIVYQVLLQKRWRTAFETKEWLLLPSQMASEIHRGIRDLAVLVSRNTEEVIVRADSAAKNSVAAHAETRAAREEFKILRDELESKQKEIKASQLGQEFHYRKPVLLRILRAIEIINDDRVYNRDPLKTLEGVKIELDECLQDNHVHELTPAVGGRVSDAVGLDTSSAQRCETEDVDKKGTIAAVGRPAYVVRGASGHQEVLVPARVTVFV